MRRLITGPHDAAPQPAAATAEQPAHDPAVDTAERPRRRRRIVVNARGRIIGWSLLLVAVALAASVFITGQVLLARTDHRLSVELSHEGTKLRDYAARAIDPHTALPFTSTDAVLRGFMRDNLPEADETYFSVVDGLPAHRSPYPPLARLDTDPDVVAFAAQATAPVERTFTTVVGPAQVAVFPIRMVGDARQAALVVVEFAGPERAETWSIIRVLAAIDALALALAGVIAWLIAGRVLRPIRQVRRTAERISESDLTGRIEVAGNDDVAQLARTFNRMLDRLEAAFAAQRAFLSDAGHELRTPLTIVRGHIELLGDDPEEDAQTVALLLDEIDRMRRLVDDLTLLAQSERPDFVTLEPTDLADVVVDVIAKASALAPRRWKIDAVAEVNVPADGQRLTQALMQLCANAVNYTGPNDTIAAGVSVHPRSVRLWVRDTGTGIGPADSQRIFARAVRGSGAVGSGSGLGLAIVSSIAAAHGGTVTLDGTPGVGSTFTIEIPTDRAPKEA